MRRYIITLLVIAFIVGTLFKAADQTGVRLMKMFGTLGIFLFGVVGSIALTRWHSRESLKEIVSALKQLEPEGFLITDWASHNDGRPNYLVIGSGGLAAVSLEDVSGSARSSRAAARLSKGRERSQTAVRWLRDRLNQAAPEVKAPLGELVYELPVEAVLVLTRRPAHPDDSAEGVTVVNPEQLSGHLLSVCTAHLLDERARIKLTRLFRQS